MLRRVCVSVYVCRWVGESLRTDTNDNNNGSNNVHMHPSEGVGSWGVEGGVRIMQVCRRLDWQPPTYTRVKAKGGGWVEGEKKGQEERVREREKGRGGGGKTIP